MKFSSKEQFNGQAYSDVERHRDQSIVTQKVYGGSVDHTGRKGVIHTQGTIFSPMGYDFYRAGDSGTAKINGSTLQVPPHCVWVSIGGSRMPDQYRIPVTAPENMRSETFRRIVETHVHGFPDYVEMAVDPERRALLERLNTAIMIVRRGFNNVCGSELALSMQGNCRGWGDGKGGMNGMWFFRTYESKVAHDPAKQIQFRDKIASFVHDVGRTDEPINVQEEDSPDWLNTLDETMPFAEFGGEKEWDFQFPIAANTNVIRDKVRILRVAPIRFKKKYPEDHVGVRFHVEGPIPHHPDFHRRRAENMSRKIEK